MKSPHNNRQESRPVQVPQRNDHRLRLVFNTKGHRRTSWVPPRLPKNVINTQAIQLAVDLVAHNHTLNDTQRRRKPRVVIAASRPCAVGHARIRFGPGAQMHREKLRVVFIDVDTSHVVDLVVGETLDITEGLGKGPFREHESESGVAPELRFGPDEDPFALIIDAAASFEKLVRRGEWLGAFQVELGRVVFFIPLKLGQGKLAVGDVRVDGVAQFWRQAE